jgi:restriction endonuclease S subunit/predicted GIY-YIG superfamily endonuclease
MSNWIEMELGKALLFNPKETIPKGKYAKKIPMEKLIAYEKKIKGFEFSEYNAGPKFRNGDTLVAKITPCLENGKTAQVDILDENEVAFGSSEFIVLRETAHTTNDFIFYLAKSPAFRKRAISCMEGTSGRKRVNEEALKLQALPIPNISTQQKIASVLSALDAKIELNHRINAELEAMAKTIYDYWFVQFDFPCLPPDYHPIGEASPDSEMAGKIRAFCTYRQTGGLPLPDGRTWFVYVILCEDGSFLPGITQDLYRSYYEQGTGQGAPTPRPRKVIHWEPFETQAPAAARAQEFKTASGRAWLQAEYEPFLHHTPGTPAPETKLRMAGKMVWREELKREIPEGWESVTLNQMAEIVGGSTPSRDVGSYFTNNGIPWITPKDLSLNSGKKFIKKGELDITDQGKASASLRILPRGSVLMSSRAPVGYLAIARNDVTTNQGFKSFVPMSPFSTEYLYYTIQNLMPVIENNSSGSTFKEVSSSILKTIYALSPDPKLILRFSEQAKSIFLRQELLEEENQQLAALRDWLLPMLMNGQVKVP